MRTLRLALVSVLLPFACAASPGPLAHSHNDYEQNRPLHDALALGFDSIEADIWLVDGRLLVAHELAQTLPDRTLESLYLEPLRDWVRSNSRQLILLIDVKSAAEATWLALEAVLAGYPELSGTVRVVVSGNRARALIEAQPHRRAALDGRLEDIASSIPAELVPLVSDNWARYFNWRGEGEFPEDERLRLQNWVEQAHDRGRLLRFWNTPDNPALWRTLRAAGVDVIGTDNLSELRRFLDAP